MRFHHSTRRGRNRLAHAPGGPHSPPAGSKLSYCRETNIHFNRRQPVAPPEAPEVAAPASPQQQSPPDCQLASGLLQLSLEEAGQQQPPPAPRKPRPPANGATPLPAGPPQLELEAARERLVAQVQKHPFWSNKAARRMRLTAIERRRILIYELVSHCERRELEWRFEPHRASRLALGPASGAAAGSPPGAHWASPPGSPAAGAQQAARAAGARAQLEAAAELAWQLEAGSPPAGSSRGPPEPFACAASALELPGSALVKRCHACHGRGRLRCDTCHGVGHEVCLSCSGRGTQAAGRRASLGGGGGGGGAASGSSRAHQQAAAKPDEQEAGQCSEPRAGHSAAWAGSGACETCHFCRGAGHKRCWVCAGRAYNHCPACAGSGQLRCHLRLNITWLNHRDQLVLNNADAIIPLERLHCCSGALLVDEQAARLAPLAAAGAPPAGAPSAHLEAASKRLLERHRLLHGAHERLLRQRHKLTQIDCQVVSFEWKQRTGHFVIYGSEQKVYIARYPFKSVCNIT